MEILDIMAIPLTQGKYALVDGEDYEALSKYKWKLDRKYACRRTKVGNKYPLFYMHREILGLKHHDGIMTDHTNHCGLDNRKANIRACSNKQNQRNSNLRIDNTSGYKGVTWSKKDERWHAQIRCDGKMSHLGNFKNKIEAAKAYDQKAKELFGEFAYLNFLQVNNVSE